MLKYSRQLPIRRFISLYDVRNNSIILIFYSWNETRTTTDSNVHSNEHFLGSSIEHANPFRAHGIYYIIYIHFSTPSNFRKLGNASATRATSNNIQQNYNGLRIGAIPKALVTSLMN